MPHPPVNLKCERITWNTASLIWDPPVEDGAVKVLNYIVQESIQTTDDWMKVTKLY